jgi:hypothetical protein
MRPISRPCISELSSLDPQLSKSYQMILNAAFPVFKAAGANAKKRPISPSHSLNKLEPGEATGLSSVIFAL